MQKNLILLVMALVMVAGCARSADSAESNEAPSRSIQNKGSDTLVNVALAWAERYRDVDPSTSIAVTGGGSGTGIAALINGTVDIANASRAMKEKEFDQAAANGVEAVEFVVAIDALAIIVHPENPVNELTIAEMSDIYTGRITNWSEVGGKNEPIVLLSRETNSGTHVYFLEEVVRRGEKENTDIFAPQTLLMPSSVGITSELRRNPNAIGYDGLGYVDEHHEKIVHVAIDEDSVPVKPSVESASDGSYPISRNLYMYTAGQPTGVTQEYLDWIRGSEGQDIVLSLGFVPLPSE